jgi:hypothetical protein
MGWDCRSHPIPTIGVINMNFSANVVKMLRPRETMECPSCHVTSELEIRCSCGVDYVYVKASQRAAEAKAANPEKSNRVLAEETGISRKTFDRLDSGGPNVPPEKRIGKDGKKQSSTKRKPNKVEEAARAAKAETGHWPTRDVLSREAGVSGRAADNALRTVRAVDEALNQFDAQALLAVAQRRIVKLEKEVTSLNKRLFEVTLKSDKEAEERGIKLGISVCNERMREIQKENKKLQDTLASEILLTRIASRLSNDATREDVLDEALGRIKVERIKVAAISPDEFMLIMRCLHPDRAPLGREAEFNEAASLWNSRRESVVREPPKRK